MCISASSSARSRGGQGSDVDLAVMGDGPLCAETKMTLIERLAQETNRPVDLIDLQSARGVLLRRILQTGERMYDPDPDHRLYAELLKRHVFYQTDFAPYRRRLLKERRRAWIEQREA